MREARGGKLPSVPSLSQTAQGQTPVLHLYRKQGNQRLPRRCVTCRVVPRGTPLRAAHQKPDAKIVPCYGATLRRSSCERLQRPDRALCS